MITAIIHSPDSEIGATTYATVVANGSEAHYSSQEEFNQCWVIVEDHQLLETPVQVVSR